MRTDFPHTHTEFVEGCFRCDLSRQEVPVCDCESMGGRFGSHRPECPWQIAFEAQVASEESDE